MVVFAIRKIKWNFVFFLYTKKWSNGKNYEMQTTVFFVCRTKKQMIDHFAARSKRTKIR